MKRYKAGEFAQHYQSSMMKKIARMTGGKNHLLKWLQDNLGMGMKNTLQVTKNGLLD